MIFNCQTRQMRHYISNYLVRLKLSPCVSERHHLIKELTKEHVHDELSIVILFIPGTMETHLFCPVWTIIFECVFQIIFLLSILNNCRTFKKYNIFESKTSVPFCIFSKCGLKQKRLYQTVDRYIHQSSCHLGLILIREFGFNNIYFLW